MIYNDSHMTPSWKPHADLVLEALSNAKQEIAQKLVVPLADVQLDVGIQLHLSLNPEQDFPYIAPPTDDELLKTISLFSQIGRIHFTEFDVRSTAQDQCIEIIKRIFRTAISSGQCASISLWNTFRFKTYEQSVFDYGPNGLFDSTYNPTESYFSLLQELVRM
jgi:hypothetical protein